jgi:hypothetical protein
MDPGSEREVSGFRSGALVEGIVSIGQRLNLLNGRCLENFISSHNM